MRPLIRNEFDELLSLDDHDSAERFCRLGFQSLNAELLALAKELAGIASVPLPKALHGQKTVIDLLMSKWLERPTRVTAAGVRAFVVDRARKRCFMDGELKELVPLREADMDFVRLAGVEDWQVADLEKKKRIVPLEAFMWFAGLHLSQGRLAEAISGYAGFGIVRWPDFGTLPHTTQQVKLAAVLMKSPGDVARLKEATGAAEEEVVAYLNACYLNGWLKETAPAPPPKIEENVAQRQLLGKLRSSLGMER
ncbi:MAG: hypothetical protein GWN37_08710 [Gammaproteobacteria bacterium]|nr:hypothetical protein [Gammaproteobacteria bacterium]NIV74897.1 hypothetical protein [Gammaproteobacteria bacterium]